MEEQPNTPAETETPEAQVVIGERYHRRRPFLVVTSVRRPVKGAKTEKKGAQMQTYERTAVVDSVSKTHLLEADLIIDVLNRTAVKNRFEASAPDTNIVEYYLTKYSEVVAEGVATWARQRGMAEGL